MFTTKNLDRVLNEVRGLHNKSIFSPKKSILAYRLSKMSSQYRGNAIERMIRDYYKSTGKIVSYIGGSASFDMMVNGRKVEVKSALARVGVVGGVVKYSYKFQHICPNNFHKLVLVFVSPEGLSVRVMDSRTAAKYLGSKRAHRNLYVGKRIVGKVLAA
jgi:hypothetical protein